MPGKATLDKLRKICLAFPEATEQVFGGHTTPTFRVRNKIFVMYHEDHDERDKLTGTSIWCKAPPGAQEILVGSDPERFYRPPYVGPKGWIGFVLDVKPIDWALVEDLARDSYLMTAPRKLAALLA